MDLKQLRALLAIAETGSVTRAADILHIVQPALSRQVKLLEEELGVQLFDRERHGMVLTSAGRTFTERVRRAMRELDDAKDEVRPRKDQVSGGVVVGFLPSAADLLVIRLMDRVRQLHPSLQLRSYIAFVADLLQGLERGEVDVALLYLPDGMADRVPCEAVLSESFFVVGPPDAALEMNTPMSLADLNDMPLVLPAPSHGVRAMVAKACDAAGVRLNIVAESASMNLQKVLVMKGVGLSVLSGCLIHDELERGALSASPLDAPALKRTLYLARSPAKAATPAAERTLVELRETVREQVHEGRWPGAHLL